MEGFLKLSTAVNITVTLIDSGDHLTGATGLAGSLTIYATKAAGTPAAITPTVTELDSTNAKGLYKLALTGSHTDTLGELQLHIEASGADPADYKWQVSSYLPGEAVTIQDGAIAAATLAANAITAAKIATDALGAAQLAADAVAEIQSGLSSLDAAGVRSAVGLASANLDTQLAGIQSDTDALQADTASLLARLGALAGSGANTLLGLLRAIMRKDATLPSDIGGTYDPATDSLEALQDDQPFLIT
jgi:hypothetical protein